MTLGIKNKITDQYFKLSVHISSCAQTARPNIQCLICCHHCYYHSMQSTHLFLDNDNLLVVLPGAIEMSGQLKTRKLA